MSNDSAAVFAKRMDRVRAQLSATGTDAVLLSVGPDLPWLIGYQAMPLERLTMLVVPVDGPPTLVIPAFEVPRVVPHPDLFTIGGWGETEDPVANVVAALGRSARAASAATVRLAVGDHTWARFVVDLQSAMPKAQWVRSAEVVGPLRAVKDAAEIASLQRAADGVDRVAHALRTGEIPLIGRTEADVSAELSRRIVAEGHAKVNFAIVASGANAASPHHHASDKVIRAGEVVLCDFGGTTAEPHGEPGYCSDITRCVYTGEPPAEFQEAFDHLAAAQAKAVEAAVVGVTGAFVDSVARDRLAEADLDQWFLHRLGHGIGVEEHEEPYLVQGNDLPLVEGNAFSIEPGFYISGKWGARIEDIVVATAEGPLALNRVGHDLAIVEA
ncbi:MAG: Xaa-Pro peptidase family protein [Actinomycetota bacterium]|nr:Xaa-Pro peptidase family protein [Actinomycetota bacterium]